MSQLFTDDALADSYYTDDALADLYLTDNAIYPSTSDVLIGVTYGPSGDDFTGTAPDLQSVITPLETLTSKFSGINKLVEWLRK